MKDKENLPKEHPKVQTIKLKADGFDAIKVKDSCSVKDTTAEGRLQKCIGDICNSQEMSI